LRHASNSHAINAEHQEMDQREVEIEKYLPEILRSTREMIEMVQTILMKRDEDENHPLGQGLVLDLMRGPLTRAGEDYA
jgi:hypothetical protein